MSDPTTLLRSAAPVWSACAAALAGFAFAGGACIETTPQPAPDRLARESSPAGGWGPAGGAGGSRDPPVEIADQSRAHDLLMTWNLEWFQDPERGPPDDERQYAAVRDILVTRQPTLVALQEVASEAAFERLLSDLEGYAGVLSGYPWTQKTALLWKLAGFELVSAHALSGLEDAGRPPLAVSLRARPSGRQLRVLVVHAKADASPSSYMERVRFGRGLKARLDAGPAAAATIVMGDFNDLLVGSLLEGAESPYQDWVDDPAYAKPTQILNRADAREASYAWGGSVDHIVMSDALAGSLIARSVDVLRDELLESYPGYVETVSDHFPVVLRLAR